MSINIERTSINNALTGYSFQEVRLAADGSAIAFVDTYDNAPYVFEPQNAVIVEVRNGGIDAYAGFQMMSIGPIAPTEHPVEPFNWFEVGGAVQKQEVLAELGGKIVEIKMYESDEMGAFPPISILLYARDSRDSVELVQVFRSEEDEVLKKCKTVETMSVVVPYKLGTLELDVQGLQDHNASFTEDADDQPPIGEGMSLADLLAGQPANKGPNPNGSHQLDSGKDELLAQMAQNPKGIQRNPNALWLEPGWRID